MMTTYYRSNGCVLECAHVTKATIMLSYSSAVGMAQTPTHKLIYIDQTMALQCFLDYIGEATKSVFIVT